MLFGPILAVDVAGAVDAPTGPVACFLGPLNDLAPVVPLNGFQRHQFHPQRVVEVILVLVLLLYLLVVFLVEIIVHDLAYDHALLLLVLAHGQNLSVDLNLLHR